MGNQLTEHSEQAAFVAEVLYRYNNRNDFIRPLFFSVPNGMWIGGKKRFALMAKYKAEGFHNGCADLVYLQARGQFHYLVIEMKAQKGSKVTPAQDEFLKCAMFNGGYARLCHGADEAIVEFDLYMQMEAK